MFRCTDCFKEYKNCPEYCDCGNDEFDQIEDIPQPQIDDFDDEFDDGSFSDEYQEQQVVQPRPRRQKRRSVAPKQIRPKKKSIKQADKIGIGVGIACVILGIIAFFSIGSGQKVHKKQDVPLLQKDYSIPTDIEPFWDSTPPSGTLAKIRVYSIV